MVRARSRGLKIAPLWRRAAAALIDAVCFLGPTIGVAAAIGVAYVRWWPKRDSEEHDTEPKPRRSFRLKGPWRIAMAIAFAPLEVRGRNWRSPGFRVMGLRYVDARTGGPVSVRSALVKQAVRTAWMEVTTRLLEPWKARAQERVDATYAEGDAARRAHPEDPEARHRAMAESFKHDRVPLSRGCAVQLLVTAAPDLLALWSARRQTLFERLAGTLLVRD